MLIEKSLYGLKQSPRQWYKRFEAFMLGHGYFMCDCDSCVYFRKLSDGSFVYLLYVDGMLIAFNNIFEKINNLKNQLSLRRKFRCS